MGEAMRWIPEVFDPEIEDLVPTLQAEVI